MSDDFCLKAYIVLAEACLAREKASHAREAAHGETLSACERQLGAALAQAAECQGSLDASVALEAKLQLQIEAKEYEVAGLRLDLSDALNAIRIQVEASEE